MKRIITSFLTVAMVPFCIMLSVSCSKNNDCDVVITVKFSNDQTAIVQGATVYVGKGSVSATGITNEKGEFSCTFQNPAVLDVKASFDTLTGTSSVRLISGDETKTTVLLK